MTKRRFTYAIAAVAATLTLSAVLLLVGCGREGGDIAIPEVSNGPAASAQDPITDIAAVIDQLAAASPAEAEAIWNGLPAEAQKAVSESQEGISVEQEGEAASDGRGYATITGTHTYRGALQQVLWTYSHRIGWYYNGIRVTSVPLDDNGTAQVYSPFWTFEGFVPPKQIPFTPPCILYTSKIMGQFARHLYPGGPIVERRFAWVRDAALGTGRGSWSSGVQ